MRVLAVSEDRRNLEDIRKFAGEIEHITGLSCHEGSLGGLNTLPVKGEVEVLLLDCRHGGIAPLDDLERLMAFYPNLATVLVVDNESPELLLRALRLGVREVIKAPLSADDIRTALHRTLQKSLKGPRGEGRVLAVMSCKGGSGATFLAANLGHVLAARTHKRVLLIDLNLQFGDAVLFVSDRRPSNCLTDITRDIQRIDMALLKSALIEVSPNYSILAAPEDPTQSVDIRPAHVESLVRFARANFDYVLLDVGRSLDTCTIQALDLADQVYPVLQLTLPFLRDAKRLFDVYHSLDYGPGKVRPILNRVERSAGDLTEQDAEKLLIYKIFATIPNHYKSVTASVNQGIPILQLAAGSPVARSLEALCDRITETTQAPEGKGLFSRLFSRG
ncbi:AAA family ATPase [Zoogloea sp.]|uniref:AAA family ATPase n=1 Tax=Zoogloea sp. TaxID=49181 RepID=UPI0014162D11|nr:MAG: MinD/ParA family protein [Zoogloea sp.]